MWDLLGLLDLLEARPEVDARRIGMTGVSLGGMHTWLTAVLDDRVAVAAPMIGVQVGGATASISLSCGAVQGGVDVQCLWGWWRRTTQMEN